MTSTPQRDLIGTRLRKLHDLLDGAVAEHYTRLGLAGFRPRYTPLVRVLRRLGPSPIRDLANELDITHSAASQTVGQMAADGLVELEPGGDGRQRIVSLTDRTRKILPLLDAEWETTTAAVAELDEELPCPLSDYLNRLETALARRPFPERLAAADRRRPR